MARTVEDYIVDFSKEEQGGGGSQHFKKGFHKVRIINTKVGKSEDKSTPYLELNMAFTEGNYRKAKKKITERLYITNKALRRFRILLNALDMKVPAKFDAAKIGTKIKGKDLVIEIDDEPAREGYEDRGPRSRVTFDGFYPEDFEPDEDEDEDEDEVEDEDEDEEDEDEEDEDEEDEDEEEPAPRQRKSASKAKAKAKPAKKSRTSSKRKSKDDDEDEDLDDLDLDNL